MKCFFVKKRIPFDEKWPFLDNEHNAQEDP
jgi:hypothetical protein